MATKFTPLDVSHIASLANIPVTDEEKRSLAQGFTKTIGVVEQLTTVDVKGIGTTHVSGSSNVTREDVVDTSRTFTHDQALFNASKTHDGYVVVDQVIAQEE